MNNNDQGYVKLFRAIEKWEWYTDINTKTLFIHCLIKANHRPQKWRGIVIETGSFVTSFVKLSKETGLSVKSVRVALNHLKTTCEVAHVGAREYSVITINKWADYQSFEDSQGIESGTHNGNQGANQGQTKGKPRATNKNEKNIKNEKNKEDSSRFTPPTLDEVIAYAKEKNQNEDLARRFYDYFTTGDWIDSKGKKVSNWKQKFITWISYNGGTQKKRVESITAYPNHSDTTDLTEDEAEDLAKQFAQLGEN